MAPILRLVPTGGAPPSPLEAARERARRAVHEFARLAIEAEDRSAWQEAQGMIVKIQGAES